MLISRALAGLWLASCASGAFVQWQHCDATSPDDTSTIPQSLTAEVARVNGTHDQLSLGVSRVVDQALCERLAGEFLVATLDVEMLGRHSSSQLRAEGKCGSRPWHKDSHYLDLTFTEDLSAFYSLAAAAISLQFEDDSVFGRESCVRAGFTPQISASVRKALICVPLFVFLFVLVAGCIRSVYSHPPESDSDSDGDEEPAPRTILPLVGDCLGYLQFIFLTGSLTLFYPGFYQPAVSSLSPYSLFLRGTMIPSRQYGSVSDGIYMVNGTYGGTFGLELMTQVVGAPLKWATWMNMVITIMIIAFAAAIALEIYRVVRRLDDTHSDGRGWPLTGLRHTWSNVFRGVLSYFLFPLVAMSCYQLDNAATLPAYHITSATLFIVVILVAFTWLLRQIPTRSLGVLIFDGSKRYHRIASSAGSSATAFSHEKTFILGLFLLTFVRGVAVGGLQISAVAQLAVLALCEVFLLASIVVFQAYSLLSVGVISAIARLACVLLMIAFVPGLAPDNVKAAIAYAILFLHMCMLLFGFLIPAASGLVKLYAARQNAPRPNVYNLRQLRRRQNSRNNLSDYFNNPRMDAESVLDTLEERTQSTRTAPGSKTSGQYLSTNSDRFYRPPRLSRSSMSAISPTSASKPSMESISVYTSSSGSGSGSGPRTIRESMEDLEARRVSPASSGATQPQLQLQPPEEEYDGKAPLGPRWNDYSFREADLFYTAPPPHLRRPVPERPPEPRRTASPSSAMWARLTGSQSTSSRGSFQVVRPALDRQSRPPPASSPSPE